MFGIFRAETGLRRPRHAAIRGRQVLGANLCQGEAPDLDELHASCKGLGNAPHDGWGSAAQEYLAFPDINSDFSRYS